MKHRNFTLAKIQKEDPKRFRTRTVLSEKEKRRMDRARRKQACDELQALWEDEYR